MKKELTKELIEMIKSGQGYLTIKHFINDFNLGHITISTIIENSTEWKVSIKNGHKYQYLVGHNFGW